MAYRKVIPGNLIKPRGRPPKKKENENENIVTEKRPVTEKRKYLKKEEPDISKNPDQGSAVSIFGKETKKFFSEPLPADLECEEMDCLDFKNGENLLSIKLFKKPNRVFRIQIFLNKTIEIRNVTYSGYSTAYSFWNLLKGNLK